jgi:uncharacterized protein
VRAARASCIAVALAVAPVPGGPDPSHPPPSSPIGLFPLSQVRLLDGPFKRAQDLDVAYLRSLDVDRLLAPFRAEAGLPARAPSYPNWESTGLGGHTAGHYLTALAQAWAATAEEDLRQRLDDMVGELEACQSAHADGYVGGIPGGRQLWAEVARGDLRVHGFGVNDKWVPWYNLHKLFAGLRDATVIAGNPRARAVLVRLADWCDRLTASLSDVQMQEMLRAEHGGMNEVLADVFAITGDPRHLALARRFSHRAVLDPLQRGEDHLDGLHANTQIPKVIGCARIAELSGQPSACTAGPFFWDAVVSRRSVAVGGNSVREHFNPADDFSSMIESREGPETCNTYNMLRLTEQLFRGRPLARYGDFYERALYNHVLSSQHPEHGGFVYFTPMRPRHYRVYSHPSRSFWCCVGSGMESHGKYGRFIYAHADGDLYVNLFIASTLRWPERALLLRQETGFPDEPRTRLRVGLGRARRFTLRVRHPEWIRGPMAIRVNGRPWTGRSQPSTYASIARLWRDGDLVEVDLPMATRLERLPGRSEYAAILHGPLVLAAPTGSEDLGDLIADDGRMAHVSTGPYLPLESAPMLVGDVATLASHVRPVPGKSLTFDARDVLRPEAARALELVPFFRVHDSRYVVYWRTASPGQYAEVRAGLEAADRARRALEARTLDRVVPGEPQGEVGHGFRGEDSSTGVNHGRTWRDAGGWFAYDLRAGAAREPLELLVTYSAGERGRAFDILVGERTIASVTLDGRERDRFVEVAYPVPAEAATASPDGTLTLRFVARPGSRAGAVYEVRLLRAERARAPGG